MDSDRHHRRRNSLAPFISRDVRCEIRAQQFRVERGDGSKTKSGFGENNDTGRRFQRLIGEESPEPYVRPPEIPSGLALRLKEATSLQKPVLEGADRGTKPNANLSPHKSEQTLSSTGRSLSSSVMRDYSLYVTNLEERTFWLDSDSDDSSMSDEDYRTNRTKRIRLDDRNNEYCRHLTSHELYDSPSGTTLAGSPSPQQSTYMASRKFESGQAASCPLFPAMDLDIAGPGSKTVVPPKPHRGLRQVSNEWKQRMKLHTLKAQAQKAKDSYVSKIRAPKGFLHQPNIVSRTNRVGDATGLPVLPAHVKMMLNLRFPGYTDGLLATLLPWVTTMRTLHNHFSQPAVFPFHEMMPYPVRAPVYQKLTSVAFYDTSASPHREVRYLGPRDAAELVYGEVDVFTPIDDTTPSQHDSSNRSSIEATRHKLGLYQGLRNIAMHKHEATGEGRWSYILVQAHKTRIHETPPHMMIAFPKSAITNESTCPHTVFPDNASLHTLASEESSGCVLVHNTGGTTLHRSVMHFEQTGSIPLIEGYRVDVEIFKPWLEAVGSGHGKIMLWKA